MPGHRDLSEQQVQFAIQNGEFGDDVISSNSRIAVIMTQDWCSQWTVIRNWVSVLNKDPDIDIYIFIYKTSAYFTAFLELKERKWGNGLIPYIRYYKDRKLAAETNYVTRDEFLDILKRS